MENDFISLMIGVCGFIGFYYLLHSSIPLWRFGLFFSFGIIIGSVTLYIFRHLKRRSYRGKTPRA